MSFYPGWAISEIKHSFISWFSHSQLQKNRCSANGRWRPVMGDRAGFFKPYRPPIFPGTWHSRWGTEKSFTGHSSIRFWNWWKKEDEKKIFEVTFFIRMRVRTPTLPAPGPHHCWQRWEFNRQSRFTCLFSLNSRLSKSSHSSHLSYLANKHLGFRFKFSW